MSLKQESSEIDFFALFCLVIQNKKWIILSCILCVFSSGLYAFLSKPVYEVEVVLLPPTQQNSNNSLLSALGGLGGLGSIAGVGGLGSKDPNGLYLGLLESQKLHLGLVKRLNLQKEYQMSSLLKTSQLVGRSLKAKVNKENGFIQISYLDTDSIRAIKIANASVEELKFLTKTIATTEAVHKRKFAEEQLIQVKNKLADAEVAMKELQQKTGVLALDAQSRATIDALSTLKASISAKEIELKATSGFVTIDNPQVQKLKAEILGMKTELNRINQGSGDQILIAKTSAPSIGLEYIRKLRDVKYYETMFEILAKQFEIAKMDEVKDLSAINVLEEASQDTCKKVKPKKSMILLLGLFFGVFLGVLVSFFVGIWPDIKNSQRYRMLKSALKN